MSSPGNRQIVVEVDGDRWSATVASLKGKRFVVHACHSPEPGSEGSLDAEVVLDWMSDQGLLTCPLHLVVADKDVQRFDLTLPAISRKDLASVLERQARGKLGADAGAPLHIGHRVTGKEGKSTRFSVLAIKAERRGTPSAAIRLIGSEDVNLAAVCEQGEAAVFSMPGDIPNHLLIVDRNSQGIRFVAMTEGHAGHERRISAPRPEGSGAAEAEDIAVELSRTLDYLDGQGVPTPEAVAFSPSLGLDEEGRRKAAGGLKVVDIAASEQIAPEGSDTPGLSTLGYLRYLARGEGLTVVTFSHKARRNLAGPAALAATLLVSLAGVVGGLQRQSVADDHSQRLTDLLAEAQGEEAEHQRLHAARRQDDSQELARVEAVLSMRRPASLLFAEVSNRAPDGLQLTRIDYGEDDGLTIAGVTRAPGRLAAIQLLARFKASLSELAFLSEFEDSVRYEAADDGTATLRFELTGHWRHES